MDRIEEVQGWVASTAHRMCKAMDCYQHLDDAIQEGMMTAVVADRSYRKSKGSSYRSWILSQVKRDIYRFLQREIEHSMPLEDIEPLLDLDNFDPLIDYEFQELMSSKADLARLADILPEDAAKVVELRRMHDMSQEETAERLGMTRAQIRYLERRIIEKLERLIG